MLSYLFDDAFYYLVPAHSFAHGAGWSFDGTTRTSGFQVLYGYCAAIVSTMTGMTAAFPAVMAIISALALLAAVWLLVTRIGRLYGVRLGATAILLVLASPYVFIQLTGGLEWSWLVLATAALVCVLLEERPRVWALFIAALLGVLVRVDFAIFVAVLTLALARLDLRVIATAAAGAGIGILATGANSLLITGQWIPNSVVTKQFWSGTTEFLPAVSWLRLGRVTGPGFVVTSVQSLSGMGSAVAIAACGAAVLALCVRERRFAGQRFALASGCTAAIVLYVAAYARGSNIMGDHYAGAIMLPGFVLTCALLSWAGRRKSLVAAGIGISAVVFSVNFPWKPPGHLAIGLHAPVLFAAAPSGARVAAWNAGLAGWRTGKHVVNLDGLANSEVVASITSGTLACYLRDARITHIMDYGFMFPGQIDAGFSRDEDARRRMLKIRNGYDAAQLFRCTSLIRSAPDREIAAEYRLFALDSGCVTLLCSVPRTNAHGPTARGENCHRDRLQPGIGPRQRESAGG